MKHIPDHQRVPQQSQMYSRHSLVRLLDSQQLFFLETIDGVRNVRELAILHGLTDELVMTELQHLVMLEIVTWSTPEEINEPAPHPMGPPARARTPIPLHTTHVNHTQPMQRTIASLTPAQPEHRSSPDTHSDVPHINTPGALTECHEDLSSGSIDDMGHFSQRTTSTDSGESSFIKPTYEKNMDWEDFCIPEEQVTARPQHQLPPPSTLTPLPLYRPPLQTPKRQGPFTPKSAGHGIKPTIKKS